MKKATVKVILNMLSTPMIDAYMSSMISGKSFKSVFLDKGLKKNNELKHSGVNQNVNK